MIISVTLAFCLSVGARVRCRVIRVIGREVIKVDAGCRRCGLPGPAGSRLPDLSSSSCLRFCAALARSPRHPSLTLSFLSLRPPQVILAESWARLGVFTAAQTDPDPESESAPRAAAFKSRAQVRLIRRRSVQCFPSRSLPDCEGQSGY